MSTNKFQIKGLQITIARVVKHHKNDHNLAIGHLKLSISPFLSIVLFQNMSFNNFVKHFREIVDYAKNFNYISKHKKSGVLFIILLIISYKDINNLPLFKI